MSKRSNSESDFGFDVLKVFRSDPVDDKGNAMELMVVLWHRAGLPVLEKRRVWRTAKGELRMRKLVGMNSDDAKFIAEHYDEIHQLLDKRE